MATTTKRPYNRKPIPAEMQRRHDRDVAEVKAAAARALKDTKARHAKERKAWLAAEKIKERLPELQAERDRKRTELAAIDAKIAAAKGQPAEPPTHGIHCSRCDTTVPLTAEEASVPARADKILRDHRANGCAPRRLPTV